MKIVIKKNNTTLLHLAFVFWMSTEILFQYSAIARLAILFFVGVTFIVTRGQHWSAYLSGYLLFGLWSLLNIYSGYAESESVAMKMTQTLFLNLLFLYCFVCYCHYVGGVDKVLKLYQWIVVIACVPCVVGGIDAALSGQRLSILGINANVIAIMAAYGAIIFFYDMLNKEKKEQRWLCGIIICFLLGTILLTGSRKGLIIPVVGIYVLICFRKPKKFLWYSLAVGMAAILALYLVMNVGTLYRLVGHRVESVIHYLTSGEITEASLDSRVDYIQLAWEESQDSLVWGHGLDCFRLLRYAYNTYSHCNYVEILYSLGWVGVFIYYSPYIYALLLLPFAWYRNKNLTALIVGLLVPYLICDYLNVTYFSRTLLLIPAMAAVQMRIKFRISSR